MTWPTPKKVRMDRKWIVTVIMIFENLLALQFFKVHFVIFDVMLGRHICLTWSSSWPFEIHFFAKDKCHANT